MKIKKSYSFAVTTSLQISIILVIATLIGKYFLGLKISYIELLWSVVVVVITSFLVIQYRIEQFIYQRIKKIYENASFFDLKDLKNTPITSDMETLSKEVSKFAAKKQLEINNLNEQAQFRREFIGNVAHEIKTPLFSIQGYLLTILDGKIDDKKSQKKYIEKAIKNVDRLVEIVEDLDLISKIEADKINLNIKQFDIVALTQSVIYRLEILARKNQQTIQFPQAERVINVFADPQRIDQVLENLIGNAIKYGKKEGTCSVTFSNEMSNKIKVCITDDGEGIAPEHLPRIFERFYRVDSGRSRSEGGSGLGLAIVKHIIEAHREKVFAYSEKGKGSRFCFTLESEDRD